MTLWNALLPAILGVSTISFWQALGLLILSRILFGGHRGFGSRGFGPFQHTGRRGFGRRGFGSRQEWKQKMAERWQQMTPEQREQLKQEWRAKCGGRGQWGSQPKQSDSSESTTPI